MIEFDKNVIYEGEEYCVKNIREVNSEYYKLEIYKCKNKKIQSFDLVYCIENSEKFMYEHYPYDYRLYDDNRYIKLIRFVFYLYECKKTEENEEIESKRLKELKEWDGVI